MVYVPAVDELKDWLRAVAAIVPTAVLVKVRANAVVPKNELLKSNDKMLKYFLLERDTWLDSDIRKKMYAYIYLFISYFIL